MPELRRDPVSGRWVIIAPERALRPSELVSRDQVQPKGTCPFCPGHEQLTPAELLAFKVPPPSPRSDPGVWTVRVFPNRYPALRVEERGEREADGFYDRMGGVGAHEVIVDSPYHERTLGELDVPLIAQVVAALRDRIRDLRRDFRLQFAIPFKNQGAAAGATLAHSHCQLIAMPLVPLNMRTVLDNGREYHRAKERCLFCDILRAEERGGPRFVAANGEMVALTPFAGRVPFETWILPRYHGSAFEELSDAQVDGLGDMLRTALRKISSALDKPAYNLILHTAPMREPALPYFHWYVEILPVLTRSGGFEWGSGAFINPTPPEEAAEFLRKVAAP